MSNSNRIKTAHLGMPHGTAQNKLRKLIIFSLSQRLQEDICFKCGSRIETVEELSIEHKIPWLYADPSLFWSLDNIAFSHRKCNRPDRLRGTQPRLAPEGCSWCTGCQAFAPKDLFAKNRSTWNGLQKYCRRCAYQMQKKSKERRRQQAITAASSDTVRNSLDGV